MQNSSEYEKYKQNYKVKLISYTKRIDDPEAGPDEISAFGALGCFEEKTPSQLYHEMKEKEKEKIEQKTEKVIENSFGRGHGSVADQNAFIFEIENLGRATTLLLCSFNYLSHLQQSLRRANADRGYELPESILSSNIAKEVISTLDISFKLYEDMIKAGVPNEDARYILPLYTRTNIQTLGDARELTHLYTCSQLPGVPSTVKSTVESMIDEASKVAPKLFEKRKMNYEPLSWYPAPQIYGKNETMKEIIKENNSPKKPVYITHEIKEEIIMKAVKERDEAELSNLKHLHNGRMDAFLVPVSIVTLHQAIRQRTWDQAVESIYDAAERMEFVTPPTVKKSDLAKAYEIQCREMALLYKKMIENGIQMNDAIGVMPHSLVVYELIHINGWNALHALGKRICTEAQLEVREIAEGIAKEIIRINPNLSGILGPQCKVYGVCPEKKPCQRFRKSINDIMKNEKKEN